MVLKGLVDDFQTVAAAGIEVDDDRLRRGVVGGAASKLRHGFREDLDDVPALLVVSNALPVAGAPFQDDDPVLLQVLAEVREVPREHRAGGRTGHVLDREEGHRLAALLGRERLHARYDAEQRHVLAVGHLRQIRNAYGADPRGLVHEGLERVVGDVEAEQLALEPQELLALVLRDRGDYDLFRRAGRLRAVAEHIGEGDLAGALVALGLRRSLQRIVQRLDERAPVLVARQRGERARVDKALDGGARDARALRAEHPAAEVRQRRERAVLVAHAQDGLDGRAADVLDGGEAEAKGGAGGGGSGVGSGDRGSGGGGGWGGGGRGGVCRDVCGGGRRARMGPRRPAPGARP